MAFIEEQDAQYIRDQFEQRLKEDITIDYFTQHQSILSVPGQECTYCSETGDLLKEVVDLSPRLHLNVYDLLKDREKAEGDRVDKIPATVFRGQNKGMVRYFGIPSGYEFAALIEGVIEVSSGEHGLSQQTVDWLSNLDKDLHIQVFVTPT